MLTFIMCITHANIINMKINNNNNKMKTKFYSAKKIISAITLLGSLFVSNVYADYFPISSSSTYDAAGLADVQAKAAQGIQCSYYGNGNPAMNDEYGYADASKNHGYGGAAYINVAYLTSTWSCYNGSDQFRCDKVLKTNNIFTPPANGWGSIYWQGQWVATYIDGQYYEGTGNPGAYYDPSTDTVVAGGYRYYKYGKASGRYNSYLSEVCRGPINVAPTLVSRNTESQTLTCPATQPSGTWVQQRQYDLYSNGVKNNYSAWVDTTKTCVAVLQSNNTQVRNLNCPSGQAGLIQQSRNYQLWTDGRVVYTSGWNVTSNTCQFPAPAVNPQKRPELCPEGYTGQKTYKWVVKYKDVVYNTVDTEGNPITYTLSTPYQEEVLDTNTCTLIPTTQTVSNASSQVVSCDAYYGATAGTYSGTVTKYGNAISTYSSASKSTTTVFVPNGNIDATACTTSNTTVEFMDAACDAGQTGTKKMYRYVTVKDGVTTSPPSWIQLSSTCIAQGAADVQKPADVPKDVSLITNMSLTSSQINSNSSYIDFFNSIKGSSYNVKENHTLNIVIDDLTAGKYDISKMSNLISVYQSIVPGYSDVKIVSVPKTLDKYIGNGGLKNTANKSLTSSTIVGNNVVVQYLDYGSNKENTLPETETITIPIVNSSAGFKSSN